MNYKIASLFFFVVALLFNGCLTSEDSGDNTSESDRVSASSSSEADSSDSSETDSTDSTANENEDSTDSTTNENQNPAGGDGHTFIPGEEPTQVTFSQVSDKTYTVNGSVITWEYTEMECESGGVLGAVETSYDENFLIQGDTLYIWDEWDCFADAYTGGGSSLEGGAWTVVGEVAIPDPDFVVDGWCVDEEPGSDVPESITATSTWSDGQLTESFAGEICFTEALGGMFGEVVDCKTWQMNLADGETMDISIESFGIDESISLKYSYDGKSCMQEMGAYEELTEASCTAAWEAYEADEDAYSFSFYQYDPARVAADESFESCMEENGFPSLDGMI